MSPSCRSILAIATSSCGARCTVTSGSGMGSEVLGGVERVFIDYLLQKDGLCCIIVLLSRQRRLLPTIVVLREVNGMLFLPREKGQGLVEYALILVLVAIVVIAILLLLGPVIGNIFSNIIKRI